MSCQAVKNGKVKRKGKPSIEWHDDSGKPVYYCYGWADYGTEDLIETCSKCPKNVIYAQRDLEAINEK
ncbi:hypothetical protein [Clostridium felsineum]|uniref:Uncharacterized protein n=1 Tax=Clostridium felsineum TaxID=36839 RepID=A0A1S8L062_9CLOT|nr:hypothetical protein [Clostridium felsineum]URZ06450.1 hypothetical protein CLROS_017830 [Clostridium felsineum]URZ11485.1 hypothetical protein CROST_022020 [Clostridium felsineum]